MFLIVGLGNPGKNYEKTRHNTGFMVLDFLFEKKMTKYNPKPWNLSKKFNAEISGCDLNNQKIILAKPMTFMNESGQPVQLISSYYKIPANNIIVIHDDKDLPLGEIKTQFEAGHAGHNGVKSIMEYLGTKNFQRVRIGIAPKNKKKISDTAKYVLQKFNILEKKMLSNVIERASEEVLSLIK